MKNNNYYSIQGWMINELNLKGNELLVYAVIFMFTQTEKHIYDGSLNYLASYINATKRNVINILQSLIDKNLVIKEEQIINNVKYCNYKCKDLNCGENISLGSENCSIGGSENCSPNNKEINNKENIIINNNIKEKSIKFKKPTIEEIKQYCSERNNKIDAERFYDYYESNGWKVGRNPMKDWKATIRTWERNSRNNKEDDDSYLNDPMYQFSETEEEKIMRYKYGYVAGAFTKEDLEKERISIPIGEEYEYIRSRI